MAISIRFHVGNLTVTALKNTNRSKYFEYGFDNATHVL